jgi:GNAT superfamily N-acetyltransferase
MSPFPIRPATLNDLDSIVNHRQWMFRDMGHAEDATMEEMSTAFSAWATRHMQGGTYRHWFAADPITGAIIAGAGLWLMDWLPHLVGPGATYRGNIVNVYTQLEYRGKGLGRQLTQTAVEWCWANGVPVVVLHASDEGRSVYERMGFQPTNEMRLIQPAPEA